MSPVIFRKHFLATTYFPDTKDNLMNNVGDLLSARNRFIKEKPTNLVFLLSKRYKWMNKYINGKKTVYELGAGAGFSKFFIKNKNLQITDVSHHYWIDNYVDALNLPFKKNSVDIFICSHMIHHLANPYKFLKNAIDCLNPNGKIIISDINTSFIMRLIIRIMRHEGWSYEPDVFSSKSICNDPSDPWSGNCAVPQMLFSNKYKFKKYFPEVDIVHFKLKEFLIFPLSGGVIATTSTINFPRYILNVINVLDNILIKISKKIFPFGMEVVLKKK